MKVEDLTQWDLDMIKSHAKDELINTNSDISKAWVSATLGAIKAMGFDIVKSDRESTWTHNPKESWYVKDVKRARSK